MMRVLMLLLGSFMSCYAAASFNVYEFNNPAQEAQFNQLIQELRCPKCQNNNLADSNAPLATDIKNYVYESVKSGKDETQITDFLISRYGEFVTYRPRNWVIWVLPFAVGLLALAVAVINIRRRRQVSQKTVENPPDMASIIAEHQQQEKR